MKMHIAHPDYPTLCLCGRSCKAVNGNVMPIDSLMLVDDCRTCLQRRESRRARAKKEEKP